MPVLVTAMPWLSPAAWWVIVPLMFVLTGVRTVAPAPSPIWPEVPAPHDHTSPACVRTDVKDRPAAIALASGTPATWAIVLRLVDPLSPSCPLESSPVAHT